MDTYEFEFPGGSAVVTTTTGGTKEAPDFCVSGPDPLDGTFDGDATSVFAAEILKLAGKVEELEAALAAAGEARENTETRLSGRIAELEARLKAFEGNEDYEWSNRYIIDNHAKVREALKAAGLWTRRENGMGGTGDCAVAAIGRIAELEEETKDLRAVLKTIFALNPEMGEAEVARLQARVESLRDRCREEIKKNASLRADNLSLVNNLETEGARIETLHRDLVSLRTDLSVTVKDGRRLEAERGVLRDRVTTLGEIAGLEQENEGNAGYLRKCEILKAENAKLLNDLRAITTEIHGSLTAENLRLEEELNAAKTYSAVMAEEDRRICREVDRLRYAEGRLTSLRLEVDERGKRIVHLESLLRGYETNGRLAKAIIDQQATRIEALTAEVRSLGSDLAIAIRTGEEQAGKISSLEYQVGMLKDEGRCREGAMRAAVHQADRLEARLSRLDALLSSEEPPNGLQSAMERTEFRIDRCDFARSAWRWFREQLGAPAGE